jgi:hypothetical protein
MGYEVFPLRMVKYFISHTSYSKNTPSVFEPKSRVLDIKIGIQKILLNLKKPTYPNSTN